MCNKNFLSAVDEGLAWSTLPTLPVANRSSIVAIIAVVVRSTTKLTAGAVLRRDCCYCCESCKLMWTSLRASHVPKANRAGLNANVMVRGIHNKRGKGQDGEFAEI